MDELVEEVREEYQIPPYFPDTSLKNYAREGKAKLDFMNPGRDLNKDLVFRSLLKNYIYYAYNHKVNE